MNYSNKNSNKNSPKFTMDCLRRCNLDIDRDTSLLKPQTTAPKSDTMGKIYTGVAGWGRTYVWISAILTTCVAGLFIIGGIYLVFKKNKLTSSTSATVTNCGVKTKTFIDASGVISKTESDCCTPISIDNKLSYNCSVTVNYNVKGKQYSNSLKIPDAGTDWKTGMGIKIYYDPADPNTLSYQSDNYRTMGLVIIAICFVIIGFAWLQSYLSNHYKIFAAAEGLTGGARMLKSII